MRPYVIVGLLVVAGTLAKEENEEANGLSESVNARIEKVADVAGMRQASKIKL